MMAPVSEQAWSAYCDRFGLSKIEAKIFAQLVAGVTDPLTLMQEAKGQRFVEAHTARVHIYRMRKKLAPHAVEIATVPGGYALREAA